MKGYSGDEKPCPKLLKLMPSNRDWCRNGDKTPGSLNRSSEEKNLELRLGPPGEEYRSIKEQKDGDKTLFSSCYFSSVTCPTNKNNGGEKFSVASAANTAGPSCSQKRAAPAPVVGWPPVRSFRKKLTGSSSSKPIPQTQEVVENKPSGEAHVESNGKGFFVKINMEGVPIGRKVNLKLYDNYEKLGSAIDELFRGLLAARKDSSDGGITNMEEEEKPISDVLDGTGEYTLVYEDNEGDRVLVGDVPWNMFLLNVKRLLVLKSAELFGPKLGANKQREDRKAV